MKAAEDLRRECQRIDGRGYKAYKGLRGSWRLPRWDLELVHVQGDPFATPSRLRVVLPPEVAGLPAEVLTSRSRRLGAASHLARAFAHAAGRASPRKGSGASGVIDMESPGQEVLDQTAVTVAEDGSLEARFAVGLPARGRRVMGGAAASLLTETVPELVDGTLAAPFQDEAGLVEAAEVNEDADHLRAALDEMELVAFVADGAVLPRRSGVDDRPLEGNAVVPFTAPDSLRVSVSLPNAGTVTGMGVPRGVTLVVGGGFHGKSTLLRALERGVYNHRPGDGRERVVSDHATVKIRAEDGRAVCGVDISPFIDGLPSTGEGQAANTGHFTTANASGSTSQAATLVEALEAGATTLLMDEDTSATNFMIRDRRMQVLVPTEHEPITPFVDRVRDLYGSLGVSTVLVLGGSGDYLDVADTVVAMESYRPRDVTGEARSVAQDHPTGRAAEVRRPLSPPPGRRPDPASIDPSKGRRPVYLKVFGRDRVLLGREELDLSAVEQLVSRAQVRAILRGLVVARERYMDGRRTVPQVLDALMDLVERDGLDALDDRRPGDLAAFRRFELVAALSRIRTLRVS